MKVRAVFFYIGFLCSSAAGGQTQVDCFEIKYLDFFGIESDDSISWSADQLDLLLVTDFTRNEADRARPTNFFIPMIVAQLRDYYPACSKKEDLSRFEKLTRLYYHIRKQDHSALKVLTVPKQLELIRSDFYAQVQNDSLLPYMSYTLDDGPFFGQVPGNTPDHKEAQSFQTEFGSLHLSKDAGKVFLTAKNNHGLHLWTRIITGNADRPLAEVSFSEWPMVKSSIGYVLTMWAEGEALRLYLKPDGGFRYYYHSW